MGYHHYRFDGFPQHPAHGTTAPCVGFVSRGHTPPNAVQAHAMDGLAALFAAAFPTLKPSSDPADYTWPAQPDSDGQWRVQVRPHSWQWVPVA